MTGSFGFDDGASGKDDQKGSRSKDYFDRYGDLKRIRRPKFWPLDKLLVEKHKFSEAEADACEFAEFLCPLLDFAPEKRPNAAECLQHPWLRIKDAKPSGEQNEAIVGKLEVGITKLKVQVN